MRRRAATPPPRGASKLRAAHKVVLPRAIAAWAAAMMVALILVAALATGGRGEALLAAARGVVDTRFASLGLRVGVIHLQGASKASRDEVMRAAALKPGQPILGLDLGAVRARVERVGWVERARVIRLLPDTVVVAVVERPLMAVWEHAGRTVVVAADGTVVGQVDPGHFPSLPLIVGEGANVAARGVLPAVLRRPALAARVTALVRVNSRRWDLRLADGGVVLLPAEGEASALAQLDALERSAGILRLGLARIDLRDPKMVVVRPRGGAAPELVSAVSGGH